MIVRSATEDDLPAMARLTLDARSFASSPDPQAWEADEDAKIVERLRIYLPGENRTAYVVEVEEGLIAFAACRLATFGSHETTAVVDLLAVSAAYRGRGIGTQLMREMMARLSAEGVSQIQVHVASDNEPAMRFWRRLGFQNLALTMGLPLKGEG